jgi:hypothetical protein
MLASETRGGARSGVTDDYKEKSQAARKCSEHGKNGKD